MIYGVHAHPVINKNDALHTRQTLESALAQKGAFPDLCLEIAKTYILEGNDHAALDYLSRALEKNPHYFEAQLLRIRLWLDSGKIEQAYHDIQSLRAKYDTYADVAFTYGLILYMQGEYADALTEARKAHDLNATYRDAHLLELVIYHTVGRLEEFARTRQQIESLDPGPVAETCFYQGLRFFEQRRYVSSIFYFDAAVVSGADKWDCQFNKACCLVKLQCLMDAHALIKRIVSNAEKLKQNLMHDPDMAAYRGTDYYAALLL